MAYAIWNKRYKKWLYGTDFRCYPRRQILSDDTPMLFKYDFQAETEFEVRGCGKDYKIVNVKVEIVG